MLIRGGLVFTGKGFMLGDVLIYDDRISDVTFGVDAAANEAASPVIEAHGCFVIPGLIDLHFHGCRGYDLCDGTTAALDVIARYEASRGVTAINPATMTYPEDKLTSILSTVADYQDIPDGSALLGVNMEGPYIAPTKIGAQNPQYVRPADPVEFSRLQEAAQGRITIVDVAPEQPGALQFIREVSKAVRVSVAHTSADYDTATRAFDAGARQVTHLFNAMPGLHHRDPGPIAAAVEHEDVMAEIIADGVHIHPAMVRLAFNMFGSDRMILVSDTMRACGLDDGTYDLGGQEVMVRGKHATLADGTLAGSVTDLMGCLQTAVKEMEIPLIDAVKAATINPARALGVSHERGRISSGCVADIVVLDSDLQIKAVVLRGH